MTLRLSLAKHPQLSEGCPTTVSVESKTRFVIGRDEQADWTLADTTKAISALHCEILADGVSYTLRDLSTNGTYLNGATERLDGAHILRDGDTIAVGLYVIRAALQTLSIAPAGARAEKPADDIWMQAIPRSASAPRGGDPAAMMTPDAGAWPLAEEAKGAPEAMVGFADMTMIFPAPKRPTKPVQSTPAVTPPQVALAAAPNPAQAVPLPRPVEAEEPAPRAAPVPSERSAASVKPRAWDREDFAPKEDLARREDARREETFARKTADAPTTEPGGESILRHVADGLGVSVDAFGGIEPAALVGRLAFVVRRLTAGVKELLDERTRAQRSLGSRQFAIPRGQARNPLKYSVRIEDALLLLVSAKGLEAEAAMEQSFVTLKAHQHALLGAAQAAARLLGEDLAPSSFTSVGPNATLSIEQKARLWDLYGALWQGLDTEDWAAGFVEAFKLHMASTYDHETS